MKRFIVVENLSPTLLASGEGGTSLIDSDIVFDAFGLPFFPGRRLKGLLRESASHVSSWVSGNFSGSFPTVEQVFGTPWQEGRFTLDNGVLDDRESLLPWLQWLKQEESGLFSSHNIVHAFSHIRQQTALDETGVAKDSSLRTIRVLRAGFSFRAPLDISGLEEERVEAFLGLSCLQLRYAGLSRNRGFGRVKVRLFRREGSKAVDVSQEALEALRGGMAHV